MSHRLNPQDEPVLDVDDIQGNILLGFNKDHQRLIGVSFHEMPSAKAWLRRILPHISSTREVFHFNTLFRLARSRRGGGEAVGLIASWFNIAFSRDGIAKLTSAAQADDLPDTAFVNGLGKDRSIALGDFAPLPADDPTSNWVVGGTGRAPDVLLIIASDSPAQLDELTRVVIPNEAVDSPGAPSIVWQELGETRPDLPGHEHFGFKDGVSQPGVYGLISKRPRVFLTPRFLKPSAAGEVNFAKPGQPLILPGNFVLGYPSNNRNDGTPVDPPPLRQPWFRNGSFLVFRRLNQNVAGFHQFLAAQAAILAQRPEFSGLRPERLGAQLVGRWPSGAPISRVPDRDDPALARAPLANNDFFFGKDTPAPDLLPGVTPPAVFPAALEGANGPVCPHAAHILKVNPRDLASDVGPDFDTLTRRILRRGIPFGQPLKPGSLVDDGAERGLHFLCYQSSIEQQFEFLQQRWMNSAGGPASGGHDIIVGQRPDLHREAEIRAIHPGDRLSEKITAPTQWVTPTGGGYFFAPSISALSTVLAADSPVSALTASRKKRRPAARPTPGG